MDDIFMIDRLIEQIKHTQCPVCVGLDTRYDYVPESVRPDKGGDPLRRAAESVFAFNREIVDAVCDVVPAVKVQAAYYEMYGVYGMRAFSDTLSYARKRRLVTIADVKRNDIGATASAYAAAYLSGADVDGAVLVGFEADFITVNPYLGTDGVAPFVQACEKTGKGLFCLVKTSNPSAAEFQDLACGGKKLYEHVADKVNEWGKGLVGQYGYSSVGAVVGATYPEDAQALRGAYPHLFFLIPGYGAQGAAADDIAACFDKNGAGGIVNSSRAILLAYRKEAYADDFALAARQAVLDMRAQIREAQRKRGTG